MRPVLWGFESSVFPDLEKHWDLYVDTLHVYSEAAETEEIQYFKLHFNSWDRKGRSVSVPALKITFKKISRKILQAKTQLGLRD